MPGSRVFATVPLGLSHKRLPPGFRVVAQIMLTDKCTMRPEPGSWVVALASFWHLSSLPPGAGTFPPTLLVPRRLRGRPLLASVVRQPAGSRERSPVGTRVVPCQFFGERGGRSLGVGSFKFLLSEPEPKQIVTRHVCHVWLTSQPASRPAGRPAGQPASQPAEAKRPRPRGHGH